MKSKKKNGKILNRRKKCFKNAKTNTKVLRVYYENIKIKKLKLYHWFQCLLNEIWLCYFITGYYICI